MKFKTTEVLARYVIDYFLNHTQIPEIKENDIDERLKNKAACFVTVTIDGNLRGCIGNAVANGPLYKSIIENAVYAISRDYRFEPISLTELPKLKVEVSVLSPLEEYHPADRQELLNYLARFKPGLMLSKSGRSALFLPQVWDQLPKPQEFLQQLCRKAGLPDNEWEGQLDFWTFQKI